ncbi:TPA: hypothetical protein ACKP06_003369 [Serratia marcescens]|nr:hypothetical protein [Serratia ureilytica]
MTKTTNKGLQITVDPEIASELAYMLKFQHQVYRAHYGDQDH